VEKFDETTKTFRKYRDLIDLASENFEDAMTAMQDQLESVIDASPEVAVGLMERAARTVTYLKQTMPRTVQKKGPFSREVLPSGVQMAEFNRNYEIAYDPRAYFDAIKNNKGVTRGMTQTFNTVWPELAMSFKEEFLDALGNKKSLDMPFNAKVNLAMVLNVDTDPVLDPTFVLPLQKVLSGDGEGGPGEAAPARAKGGGLIKSTMSGLDKVKLAQHTTTNNQRVNEQPKPWKTA